MLYFIIKELKYLINYVFFYISGVMMNILRRCICVSGLIAVLVWTHSEAAAQSFTMGRGGQHWMNMELDGYEREYLVHLPRGYQNNEDSVALVIALHGAGGNAAIFERKYHFSEKADQAGFIAVYPLGTGRESTLSVRTWNAGECCDFASKQGINDVKFISRLIDTMIKHYRVNPARVYATGMSNGGMLAYRLAAELPFKIAAIAPVSCTMVFDPPAKQARAVPVIHIHSRRDKIVPYEGSDNFLGYRFPAVDSVMNIWAVRNDARNRRLKTFRAGYLRKDWLDARGVPIISLYVTEDGGHSWPGGDRTRPGAQPPSRLIKANDLIWDFFMANPMP